LNHQRTVILKVEQVIQLRFADVTVGVVQVLVNKETGETQLNLVSNIEEGLEGYPPLDRLLLNFNVSHRADDLDDDGMIACRQPGE